MIQFLIDSWRMLLKGNPQAVMLFAQILHLIAVIVFLLALIEFTWQPIGTIRFWFWRRKHPGSFGITTRHLEDAITTMKLRTKQ